MTFRPCDVKTICVELQRPGPPHNRLLSPLTRYLASTTEAELREVSYPDEHAQLLRKLKWLRAATAEGDLAGNEERLLSLRDLSRDVSRFLAGVPGLIGQLSPRGCDSDLVHLEIVTSAAELAMLPYELSSSLESAGENPGLLLLSGRPRVSLTRRVRSVPTRCAHWPLEPKILFVGGFPTSGIPFEQHLEALLRALQPWVPPLNTRSASADQHAQAHTEAVARLLTVLENATIDEVAQACARDEFTHVHVLAHGALNPRAPGGQFGIGLAGLNKENKKVPHVVSGEQFATAIRRDGGRGGPSIVTVASCDGGNVAEVLHTGATFLHDLHRSGVSLVVGSQFPLSFQGSIDLCERLYEGLLLGNDPRELLADLRLRLHSRFADRNHDWASLVAYAALPSDLDRQLEELRYRQGRLALNVAIDYFDRELNRPTGPPPVGDEEPQPTLTQAETHALVARMQRSAALMPMTGRFRVDGIALVGVLKKRMAQALFGIGKHDESLRHLDEAAALYARSFDEGVRYDDAEAVMSPLHWSLTQALSLRLALQGTEGTERLTVTARTIADQDVDVGRSQAETWALTSLLELDVIDAWRAAVAGQEQPEAFETALRALHSRTARLLRTPENADAVYSTRRQLLRYTTWWWTASYQGALARHRQHRPSEGRALHVPPKLLAAVESAIASMDQYLKRNVTSVSRRR